jgi:small-conductance mechanosensitive channel
VRDNPIDGRKKCAIKFARIVLIILLACSLPGTFVGISSAQQTDQQQEADADASQIAPEIAPQLAGAPVEIDGRPILVVYVAIAGISPEERAANIADRIVAFAKQRSAPVELIRSEDRGAWSEILAGNTVIMGISEGDARAALRPRSQLAAEYAEAIRRTVTTYRREHTWSAFLRGLLFTVIATAILVVALLLLVRVRRAIRFRLDTWVSETEKDSSRVFAWELARHLVVPLMGTSLLAILLAFVALLEVYIAFVLYSFPSTRYTAIQMNRWTISKTYDLGSAVWNYLPSLVTIIIIVVAARYLIRLNGFLFTEIQQGKWKLHGFYPDWAQPTAKLVRLLILVATAIVMFPYLPGSSSPAFRGISVFLGVLLSLGSTSAVSHAVAGAILTYMRSFNVGDFVKIGDAVGEVVERNLLVTRICTQKNEIVTIPNGSVLGGIVINYSVEAHKNGVIFYTRVSIGYAAPWKEVHQLLIDAALSTSDIMKAPRPFVLQTSLDDFYVSYELNAFTTRPQRMQEIYSELRQNIQDKFNEGGIEINSPHYTSLRDGNHIAIPDAYVSKNYQEPAFGVREVTESEAFMHEAPRRASSKTSSPHS